jgi:guanylate kinase
MSLVFVISAPSGSGKSTLVERMLERDSNLLFSTSYTTRERTQQDKEGLHYIFTDEASFVAMIKRGEFLEWAKVHDHYYGTHLSVLEKARASGKDLLLDIDVQGARQLKETIPDAVRIFVLAPSRDELAQRLRRRQRDAEDVIQARIARAADEIRGFAGYDYVVVNDSVSAAEEKLYGIIQAERCRTRLKNVQDQVLRILGTFAEPNQPGG